MKRDVFCLDAYYAITTDRKKIADRYFSADPDISF